MTIQLIIPTAINLITHVNETIVSSRRRGFDATLTLPSLRDRAKAAHYESSVMAVETVLDTSPVGTLTP